MRLWVGVAGLLALVAGGAVAEPGQVETRFGPIRIIREKVDEIVLFGGVEVRGPGGRATDHRLRFEGVWPLGPEDAVLVGAWAGGNDVCASSYFIVAVSSAGARATSPLGRCTTEVMSVDGDAGRLEVHLRPSDPRFDRVVVVFFNGQASETGVPKQEVWAPLPGGGDAVTRWRDEHPYTILENPEERQRFLAIMPRDKLFELTDRLAVAVGAEIRDGWLLAFGCMAHHCGFEMGGLAIEVATGRAEAVLFHEGADVEIFGGTPGSIHPDLGAFARTGNY